MTLGNPLKAGHARELVWLAPFLCIALMALALLRPLPRFPVPAHGRTVVDAEGIPVHIEIPFRGIVLTWGAWGVDIYLENTHAPETVLNAGGPLNRAWFAKQIMSWIYPQVLMQDSLWDAKIGPQSQRAKSEIETLLAYNPGAYLGNGGYFGMVPMLQRVGLPALSLSWYKKTKNWDEVSYSAARVDSALIEHPERGEALIARYRRAFADIRQELRPETLADRPRVLMMGSSTLDRRYYYVKSVQNSYQIYFPPAGIENASAGFTGEQQDAERILSMDPDIIFLTGARDVPYPSQGPKEFMSDPRWQGLKAVREKRVYRMLGGGGLGMLIFQPIWVRWMAEIAHPDRMQPRVRQVLRERIVTEFGYRMSDDQIDAHLHLDENKDSAGYERFTRNYQPKNKKGPT